MIFTYLPEKMDPKRKDHFVVIDFVLRVSVGYLIIFNYSNVRII